MPVALAALAVLTAVAVVGPWPVYQSSKFRERPYFRRAVSQIRKQLGSQGIAGGRLLAGWAVCEIAVPAGTPLAGYSPAIRAGDFVFLAGQVPTDWKSGIAPEARVDPNFWEGSRIERETRYILENMALTLEAAGSSMPNVVKAQVYLTDINDLPRLDRVWREAFPGDLICVTPGRRGEVARENQLDRSRREP